MMRHPFPLVTIIMATYNRERYIVEALQSIKNQAYPHWECFIIDDGGTDNTKEVITPILNEDARFSFLKRPDTYKKGLPGSRNYGLDLAKGDCIIFFDDDDIVHPENLSYCLAALQDSNADFCHYQKQSFVKELPEIKTEALKIKRKLSKEDIEIIVMGKYALASCTVLWKSNCFNTIRFNEELLYAEEWECYTNIVLEGFKGVSLKNTLYYNRKHEISNTGQFWKNNPIQLKAKKKAICLIAENLKNKEGLTFLLQKYVTGLAISYRDINLLKTLIKIIKPTRLHNIYLIAKYYLFPLWSVFYRTKKRLRALANN